MKTIYRCQACDYKGILYKEKLGGWVCPKCKHFEEELGK